MREESDAGAVERGWVVDERIEERDWLVQVQLVKGVVDWRGGRWEERRVTF